MEAIRYEESSGFWQPPRLLLPHAPVQLISSTDESRAMVEQFIARRFRHAYQAEIHHFLPFLLTASQDGSISSAIGFQACQPDKGLFLEQYLDCSVETILSVITGQAIPRESVIEIGNLAANPGGTSLTLFVLLIAILHRAGYEWIVFTATKPLQRKLEKLHFHTLPLGCAKQECLVDKNSEWGQYYKFEPLVLAGNLADAASLMNHYQVVRFLLTNYQRTIDNCVSRLRS